MDLMLLGLLAGAITSSGFIPQLVRGFRTKKLEDVSSYMPMVLASGMTLWFLYGIMLNDISIMIANSIGISCNLLLLTMKKIY